MVSDHRSEQIHERCGVGVKAKFPNDADDRVLLSDDIRDVADTLKRIKPSEAHPGDLLLINDVQIIDTHNATMYHGYPEIVSEETFIVSHGMLINVISVSKLGRDTTIFSGSPTSID